MGVSETLDQLLSINHYLLTMKGNPCYWNINVDKPGLLAVILGLGLLFSGCTGNNQSSNTDTANTPAPNTPRQRFDGVTITVLSKDPSKGITEPLIRRGPDFEQLTGAKIDLTLVEDNNVIYADTMADFKAGTKKYDLVLLSPQWMADYVSGNYLENLTPRIQADPALQWDDISPFFRDFLASYRGNTYIIPLDGDFVMAYYRSDLLEQANLEPPATWEEYIKIAEKFQGQDLNGDGVPDYGSCINRGQNPRKVLAFASAYLQSQGTKQGAFFDPDTLKPLVNNPAFGKALDLYKETLKYGPADELDYDYPQQRGAFISGRCALTLDWGDIGTLALEEDSKVTDKVGAVVLPGAKEVLDRSTGQLVTCDKITCPYAVNGVNYAPYAGYGGFAGAINAAVDPEKKDAAYAFLSYLSQPEQSNVDVTIGITGYNPYRISQFTDRQVWLDAGMSFEAASKYLGAIGVSLRSPNMVLDISIAQNQRYLEEVMHPAIRDFLTDKITREQALQQIEQGWEKLTDEIGRESQLEAYRASLGL